VDPNLFHLDWDRTFEVIAAVATLSVILERFLALIYENRGCIRTTVGSSVNVLVVIG